MAIAGLAALQAAPRTLVPWIKASSRNSVLAAIDFLSPGLTGASGAVLPTTGIANGVIPTPALYPGSFPVLPVAPGGQSLYLCRLLAGNSGRWRLILVDELFRAGDWAQFTVANNALVAPPTIPAARLPGGDYKGTEIWISAGANSWSAALPTVQVQYTNQDGVTGCLTGPVSPTVPNTGTAYKLPLQAGDTGVEKLESVNVTAATAAGAATFFASVVRPIEMFANFDFGKELELDVLQVGLPEIRPDTCLGLLIWTVVGSPSPTVDFQFELATG